MKLFDTHAHCDDERIEKEYENGTEGLITDCLGANIGNIVNVGTNFENSKRSVELAEKFDGVYAAVGIHPSDCQLIDYGAERAISEIEELLSHPKVVAIGEIGLDYHYDDTDRERQLLYFRLQMELAKKHGMAVIIHDRDAHGDCMEVVREFPEVKGIFHSFSGSAEMARELCKMGWYVSFSGTVTFKNASKPKEACVAVDEDKILVETDSPYLPPVPHRGEMNIPSYVEFTAREIAKLRGISFDEMVRITNENAKRVFGIKE
ncbi:MAG: TatD family hydrolase [Eubacteriales bacterium]